MTEHSQQYEQLSQHQQLELAADETMAEVQDFKRAVGMMENSYSAKTEQTESSVEMPPNTVMPGSEFIQTPAEEQLAEIRTSVWNLYDRIQSESYQSTDAIKTDIEAIQSDVSAFGANVSKQRQKIAESFNNYLSIAAKQVDQNVDMTAQMLEDALTDFNYALRLANIQDRIGELRQELAQGTEREIDEVAADFRELRRDVESLAQNATSEARSTLNSVSSALNSVIAELESGGENVLERIDALLGELDRDKS